ncbi:hypothetical protein LUZ61_007723 [Rhynchospora tenuis]|uniref:CW-type domain-containing protein n=1 Tax=Rhynchospora tenuis TaxID=198213 RepID=A0AAD5ZU69_9POAL|nr:hypothetical protein LUZ61_007723 [Rhynchospora tenuis]
MEATNQQQPIFANSRKITKLALASEVPKIVKQAAQCVVCSKWRLVPTVEAYELVRAHATIYPFICQHARMWGCIVNCTDEQDVFPETDESLFWALDVPNIPVPPPGWKRIVSTRNQGDFNSKFCDVRYHAPPPRQEGFSLLSRAEIDAFLRALPEYGGKGVSMECFSFKCPKPLRVRTDN